MCSRQWRVESDLRQCSLLLLGFHLDSLSVTLPRALVNYIDWFLLWMSMTSSERFERIFFHSELRVVDEMQEVVMRKSPSCVFDSLVKRRKLFLNHLETLQSFEEPWSGRE